MVGVVRKLEAFAREVNGATALCCTYTLHVHAYNIYIYIYDIISKQKKYIYQKDLVKISEFNDLGLGKPNFIDNNTLLFVVGDIPNYGYSSFIWKINESSVNKVIRNYPSSIDINNGLIVLCTPSGAVSLLDSTVVSVKSNQISSNDYLVYKNNQLEYYSDMFFNGQSMIYDTTGKMIANLGTQQFVVGKNIIRINQPLQKGVYLLTIKNDTNQFSYKFIVE